MDSEKSRIWPHVLNKKHSFSTLRRWLLPFTLFSWLVNKVGNRWRRTTWFFLLLRCLLWVGLWFVIRGLCLIQGWLVPWCFYLVLEHRRLLCAIISAVLLFTCSIVLRRLLLIVASLSRRDHKHLVDRKVSHDVILRTLWLMQGASVECASHCRIMALELG